MSARIEVEVGADIKGLKASLDLAKKEVNKFGAAGGQSLQAFTKGTNSASFALTNLGRVAQDAPFGFIGIQNNLNPLLESFSQLKKETGSTGSALKALGSSLMGPAGLGIALSVVSSAVLFYQQYQQRAKKDIDGTSEAIKKQREELVKTPYEKAVLDLASMTRNIGLAKDSLLSKNAVLKQYNEGIGLTIGKVTSLDEAEQALVKNGSKYLQLMFLKASAEVAFKKAAEESYNQAKKQQELDAKKPVISKDFDINADRSAKKIKESLIAPLSSFKNLTNDTVSALDGVNRKIEAINPKAAIFKIDQDQLTELKKNTGKATEIAISAQQQVIDYAKKNGFDLNGLFGVSEKAVKEVNKRLPDIEFKASFDIKDMRNLDLSDTLADMDQAALGLDSLGKSIKAVTFEVPKMSSALLDAQNQILASGFTEAFSGIGDAIGGALANGSSLIEAFGQSALSSIGDILVRFGKLILAAGVASTALGKALSNPLLPGAGIAAIGAGVALIAIGAAVKGFSANIGGNNSEGKASTATRKIPGFATGVKNFSGGLAVVGERGPELVNLPKGSDVIANNRLGSMMSNNTVIVKGDLGIEMGKLVVAFKQEEALRGRRG